MTLPSSIYTNKDATALITPPAIPLHPTDVEWVRADVAQAEKEAAVAAELEACVDIAKRFDDAATCMSCADTIYILEAIRARGDTDALDARAALDAMLAKAWEEGEQAGLRKAGAECHAFMLSLSNDIPPVEHTDIDTCIILRHRIQALIDRTAEGDTDALDARDGRVRAEARQVKPLKWEETDDSGTPSADYEWHKSETPFGKYAVGCDPEGDFWAFRDDDGLPCRINTLEAAKDAAQADYERRILSALEPDQHKEDG